MSEYYSKKLSANKLKRCYDIASPRIKQYLKAEINFVVEQIRSSDKVLELGCGYGRVLRELAKQASKVVGIDTSFESLELAKEFLLDYRNIELHQMNANSLSFKEET
ncbi:MAG: class I SAM-dependent methyltransferase, partial [Candidatus Heimdallarchaeota archaeon]|nr:class I SAM-dependent methyltransferase [Candidatus Heimdallarchaeota archaeon]